MPKQIGGMLGHAFELEIVKLLKDYNVQLAATAKEGLIELTIPDITGQIYQTASHNITTDVDLGIRLKGMTEFTYGISAKTLTKGMKFKSKKMDKLFSEPVSNET
jgi:hypothetical protein